MVLAGDRRATLVGFAVALGLLAVVFSLVGVARTARAVAGADGRVVAALLPVALGWLACWGLALRAVLAVVDVEMGAVRALLVYAAATFANNVTPFGQAGGEPVTAFIIARASEADYERGLAAIASVDALHFVPTVFLAGAGLVYFATRLTFGRRLQLATGAVAGFALAIPVVAYLAWRYRRRLERAVVNLLAPVLGLVGRVVPRREAPSRAALHRRVRSFAHAIGRVAADRRRLGLALLFSTAGWLGLMASLWLSLYALGHVVAFPVVMVAVPVAAMASIAPVPGGLGALDAILVALVTVLPGVGAATAAAAVVLHRGATYVFPVALGAVSASFLTTGALGIR